MSSSGMLEGSGEKKANFCFKKLRRALATVRLSGLAYTSETHFKCNRAAKNIFLTMLRI